MAWGRPDYHSIARIVEGALQVYEKSGAAPQGTYEVEIATGRGIVYGGYFFTSRYDSEFGISVDDQPYVSLTPEIAKVINITRPWGSLLYLCQYAEEGNDYTLGISGRFTFERSLRVKYTLWGSPSTAYNIRIYYALIL